MSRREFPAAVKVAAFTRAKGRCEKCTARLYPGNFRYNHRIPDAMGGEPTLDNCEVLCRSCDSEITYGRDIPTIAKAKRQQRAHIAPKVSRTPLPCGKRSGRSKKMNGTIVTRQTQSEKHRATMAAIGRPV